MHAIHDSTSWHLTLLPVKHGEHVAIDHTDTPVMTFLDEPTISDSWLSLGPPIGNAMSQCTGSTYRATRTHTTYDVS